MKRLLCSSSLTAVLQAIHFKIHHAYVKQAQFMTGDQFMLNLQSKYSSDETVVKDTFVDESMPADLEACAENAEVINTGDQYIFNSQSKYSSETVEATVVEESTKATVVEESTEANVVEESTEAAESSDHKTFANLFEELVDKLNDMAGLLPVSKTGKAKAKEGSATDGENEDLVGLEEQLLKMRFQSLHQNNRYISSIFEYNGVLGVDSSVGDETLRTRYRRMEHLQLLVEYVYYLTRLREVVMSREVVRGILHFNGENGFHNPTSTPRARPVRESFNGNWSECVP
nr:uncharacterized protein LOC109166660 [Ipomoea batatas]